MTRTATALSSVSRRRIWAGMALAALLVWMPAKAQAQVCEAPGQTAAAAAVVTAQTALLTAQYAPPLGVLPNAYLLGIQASQALINTSLAAMEAYLLGSRLDRFWEDWSDAMRDSTAQIHAGTVDQSRHFTNMFDSSNMTENARTTQLGEIKARKDHLPTEEGCTFDTLAVPMQQAAALKYAASSAMSDQFIAAGLQKEGTPAARGPQYYMAERMNRRNNMCDPNSNGGVNNCAPGGRSRHLTPSRTLFGRETLTLNTPNSLAAVEELVQNVVAPKAPVFKSPASHSGGGGQSPQLMQENTRNRAYLAKIDAVAAPIYDIVGERLPGAAPGDGSDAVSQIRAHLGLQSNAAGPDSGVSEREVRQAVIEKMWDPNFFIQLNDSPSTIVQKENYLQAYNLMMLYKMIEKTEKIANVYSVQAGVMLEKRADRVMKQTAAPVHQ